MKLSIIEINLGQEKWSWVISILVLYAKTQFSKNFENLILSADKKLIGPNCPTRETATASTCLDHVNTTPRLIQSNVYDEKCDISDRYGTLLVTGVIIKILRSERVYRVVKDMEKLISTR